MELHLYQITEEARILDTFFEESGGEITPELEELLSQVEGDLKQKVENICKYRADLTARIEMIDREIDRLSALKKSVQNQADGLKNYLHRNLQAMQLDKVETPLFKVSRRKNPPSVVIVDETAIPPGFCVLSLPAMKVEKAEDVPEPLRHLIVSSPSKSKIAEALKVKVDVPGAKLEQGERLEIK